MLRNILSILLLCLTADLVIAQDSNDYPVFAMSDSYSMGNSGSIANLQKYQLTNSKGFKLDYTGYDFSAIKKTNEGKYPDKIFIICQSGTFMVDLNPSGITTVDNSTMVPVYKHSDTFSSFRKGEMPVVLVGELTNYDGRENMTTFWGSLINVL